MEIWVRWCKLFSDVIEQTSGVQVRKYTTAATQYCSQSTYTVRASITITEQWLLTGLLAPEYTHIFT